MHRTFHFRSVCLFAAAMVAGGRSPGLAQMAHMHGDHEHGATHQPGAIPQVGLTRPANAARIAGPHGGQVSDAANYRFEVVYGPQETRVHVYDSQQRPLSARGLGGEMAMTVRGNTRVYRFPLQYVRAPQGDDYLAARVDVRRVRDGDMDVTMDVTNLPGAAQRTARFSQTFALSRARPTEVVVAELTAADQSRIAAQGVCPVMGTRLGEHGPPIKVLVDGQPLYLCCKGCISRVRSDPTTYLDKVRAAARPASRQSTPPSIRAAPATAADAAAIRAQATCPVMGTQLGGHGAPIKITIDGQSLFVCCRGCIRKVQENPGYYLAKAHPRR